MVPLLKLVLGWGTCRVSILHLENFYSSFITQLRGCLLQEAFPDHFPDRPGWAGCLLWVSTCPPVLCCGVARVLLGGCSLHLTRPFQDGDVWVGLPGGSPGQGTAWADWSFHKAPCRQPNAWCRCRRRKGSPRSHHPPQGCPARPEAVRSHSGGQTQISGDETPLGMIPARLCCLVLRCLGPKASQLSQ